MYVWSYVVYMQCLLVWRKILVICNTCLGHACTTLINSIHTILSFMTHINFLFLFSYIQYSDFWHTNTTLIHDKPTLYFHMYTTFLFCFHTYTTLIYVHNKQLSFMFIHTQLSFKVIHSWMVWVQTIAVSTVYAYLYSYMWT